jgi:DNA-binding phage protein
MTERIAAANLPEFDAAHHLDSDKAIAAYLADVLDANDAVLLAAALEDVARASQSFLPNRGNFERPSRRRR